MHVSPASGTRSTRAVIRAEHDVATAFRADGVGAGTVDRRPDDLGTRLGKRDRRRVERLAPGDRAHPELEAVVPRAADEALAEVRAPPSDMSLSRLLRDLDGDRCRRLHLHRRRSCLRDERVAVQESHAVADVLDAERPVERRRQAQRHLDLLGIDEGGEPPAGIPSVRGRERAAIVARERDLHGGQPTHYARFVTVRRKP